MIPYRSKSNAVGNTRPRIHTNNRALFYYYYYHQSAGTEGGHSQTHSSRNSPHPHLTESKPISKPDQIICDVIGDIVTDNNSLPV